MLVSSRSWIYVSHGAAFCNPVYPLASLDQKLTELALRFPRWAGHRAIAFDLSPPQSYGILIKIKIRHTVAAFLVASSYLGFAQYFLPCPRPDTRIMLVQKNDSDDWIQIALSMDEQTMVLIHTGIGLAIIVITALIAWYAPGPKWYIFWTQHFSDQPSSKAHRKTQGNT